MNEEQHNSSLLIPKDLIDFWNERTRDDEDSRRDYLHLLLKKYRFLVYTGILEKSETLMTKYQEKDQRLRKIAIRPYPDIKVVLLLFNSVLRAIRSLPHLKTKLLKYGIPIRVNCWRI